MIKSQKIRQFILGKCAPIFNVKGVAGTAMNDILEVTKMGKGGVYAYFRNKEELSCFAVDYNLNTLTEKMYDAVGWHSTAKDILFAYLDFLSDPLTHPVPGGCPLLNFGVEADDTNPVIRKKVNKVIERTQQNIASVIEHGIANGEFKRSWNPKEFALKMFAMLEGGILFSRVAASNFPMKTIVKILKSEIEEQLH